MRRAGKARKYWEMTHLKPLGPSCRMPLSCLGPLAQLGERLVRNQEVGGSSPPRSTNLEIERSLG